MSCTRSILLGGALARLLGIHSAAAVAVATVTVTADRAQVRMNVGESFALDYRIETNNEAAEPTGLNVWDTPPAAAGVTLTSDNQGRYQVPVGAQQF